MIDISPSNIFQIMFYKNDIAKGLKGILGTRDNMRFVGASLVRTAADIQPSPHRLNIHGYTFYLYFFIQINDSLVEEKGGMHGDSTQKYQHATYFITTTIFSHLNTTKKTKREREEISLPCSLPWFNNQHPDSLLVLPD